MRWGKFKSSFRRRLEPFTIAMLWILAFAGMTAGDAHALTFGESPYCLTTEKSAKMLRLQIAATSEQLMHGLMHRTEIKPYDGMYFDFGAPQKIRMWMKNTPHPLDMLFIDAYGKIVHTVANTVPYSEAIIEGPEQVAAVIELEAGRASKEGFTVGTRVAKGRCP